MRVHRGGRRGRRLAGLLLVLGLAWSCGRTERGGGGGEVGAGGGQAAPGAETTPGGQAAPTPGAQDTAQQPAGGGGGAAAAGNVTPQLIAQGDKIFHGDAGGTCAVCHGQDGNGTGTGPSLKDKEWLHGDGSYEFIVKTVQTGVPQPKKFPAPMPPMGGASLNDEQVRAVAAYVYSLSHPGGS